MLRRISLTSQISIGMLVGGFAGLILGPQIAGIQLIGNIFLRLIQMAVVLLIFGAVIEAIGGLAANQLGRLGGKTAGWFLITTLAAAVLGLLIGYLVNPGIGMNLSRVSHATEIAKAPSNIDQTILNFFSSNIFDSLAKGNVIQVIIFAILFGIVLNQANKAGTFNQVLSLIKQLNQLTVKLVMLVMRTAPIGIASLMAWVTADSGLKVVLPLLKFLMAFGLGSVVFLTCLFTLISWYAKIPLGGLIKGFSRIILIAFTTTSSAIALPVEMTDAESRLGVSKSISQLVLPLGMALNSNGLAMYLSLACLTLTQLYGISLSFVAMLKIILLSVIACLGTVVVPGGGLVALTIVVPTLGLPTESIAILAGIDWFSGMFRTVLNVVGDTTTAIAIAADEKELNHDIYEQARPVTK
ncbi:dicarboxylate/amino acid:cation symporter [Lentilactobacillus diolivorans]|uniref:dicarboxylate/amino acid:cation symporter n=1 Tax=Lentilactobacillus diolivorans TaxID=179838 RepID=UPI0024683E1F|nr:dicarboxylate/amino acid:cation symporter [Lentilactobacillus diolivorans]MDH5104462.1 dicarboxylate/amino acid:cation symporter [Lentilactobacillus diolivorans]